MTENVELEARFARARDPILIPGVYNYCLQRCGRCPFTGRCFLYRQDQAAAQRRTGEPGDIVSAELQGTVDLVRVLREQAEADRVSGEAASRAAASVEERLDERVTQEEFGAVGPVPERPDAGAGAFEHDALHTVATDYEAAAYEIVDPLRHLSPFHEWPRDVDEALDTISWNAGAIRAKLYRALWGQAKCGDDEEEDPVQNDWNGSAKVARLAIADSIAAWDVLFVAGDTPNDAPIRQRRCELEELDEAIARRFPHAMAFVRPGFDEPEVAAGALTSAAPLEPRPPTRSQRQTVSQRIKRWFVERFRA